jgi:hypothetical protein
VCQLSDWFSAKTLALNVDKTNIIKFVKKNLLRQTSCIDYKIRHVEGSIHAKLLGVQSDNRQSWKNHIHQLVPKLSGACHAVRSVSPVSNTDTLRPFCDITPIL